MILLICSYNANNQLAKVQDCHNHVTTYAYDNNGRLISESRPNDTIQTYTYNANGQLVSTIDQKADGSIINEYTYEYDADGNIITEDSINEPNYDNITIPSSEMNYGSANRLVDFNGTAISYDNDGNMLNTPLGNKWGILTYNSRNILTDVVTSDGAIKYEYDAEGYRIAKTENGNLTSYVVNPNVSLSQVLTSTKDGETTYYIYGLGLIAQEGTDSYKTYHYDYRGSTTAITDEQGNTTDRIYYDVYGSIINRIGTTDTPFLYVGQYGVETDDNGLYHMRARYYNPQIQRFVNIDPIRDGLNWYGYTGGNTINYIDPSGLAWYGDYWVSSGNILLDTWDYLTHTQIANPTDTMIKQAEIDDIDDDYGPYSIEPDGTFVPAQINIKGYEDNIMLKDNTKATKSNKHPIGITIANANGQLVGVGGKNQYLKGEIICVTGGANLSANSEFIGAGAKGSLYQMNFAIRIPLPYKRYKLEIGVSGDFASLGANVGIDPKELKYSSGVSVGIGVGGFVGLAEK